MARIDKSALTKLEIIQEATMQFLDKGYTHTTVASIAKALEMSPGNLTFHFPTKEHLLAQLVDMLCDFQWRLMEKEADEGFSSLMAICLELTSMASACDEDEVIRDFFVSAYTSPLCLGIIRRNDARRNMKVFKDHRPDWTEEQFLEAELLVSGIEYATLMTTGEPVALETRIIGALHNILGVYGIEKEIRDTKIQQVFAMDYRGIGRRILAEFKAYVEEANDHAFHDLLQR